MMGRPVTLLRFPSPSGPCLASIGFMRLIITLFMLTAFQIGTASADPALWKAERDGQAIYLFGTLHSGGGDETWRSDAVLEAFGRAGTLVLETPVLSQAGLSDEVRRLGVAHPRYPLSAWLPTEAHAALYNASVEANVPMEGVERLRPWLAALVLGRGLTDATGPDPFIDRVFEEDAARSGKWLVYLEQPETQARRLASLPDAIQADMLGDLLGVRDRATSDTALRLAWLAGDLTALDRRLNAPMRARYPVAHQRLIVSTNAAWAQTAAELSRTDTYVFMAVGTAHLVGPDGIQAHLTGRGFAVTRIN